MRLDFGNLPLRDVVVRLSLPDPLELTFAGIEELSRSLREAKLFTTSTEPREIEAPPGLNVQMQLELGRLHAVGFVGHPQGLSLTVQPHVLILRWTYSPGGPAYPRYDALRKALADSLTHVAKAFDLAGDKLKATKIVNMGYMNHISVPAPESNLRNYFAERVKVKLLEDSIFLHEVNLSWRAEENLDLRFSLARMFSRESESQRATFRLLTVAGFTLPQSTTYLQGLDRIHDRLQVLFLDVLSQKAKEEWKLKESAT